MKEQEITLEDVERLTGGRFVYVKDYMNPHQSYAYGHAGGCVVRIKEKDNNHFSIQYRSGQQLTVTVLKEKVITELENYDKEMRLKHIFAPVKQEYENIIKLAATTINPYRDLSIDERVKKMERLLLEEGRFDNLEEADLFLLGLDRVRKSISFNSYGSLEINYYGNRNRDFFLIDREKDKIEIYPEQKELEAYILNKLKG